MESQCFSETSLVTGHLLICFQMGEGGRVQVWLRNAQVCRIYARS